MVLNYGVIGCGSAAKIHFYHLRDDPRVEITAAADPSGIFPGIVPMTAYRYKDYKEMLDKEFLYAVSICSPHKFHYEQVLACAQKGINIICEKPLALSYDDAQKAVAACDDAQVKLAMMMPRRLFNNTQSLTEVIRKNDLGKIDSIQLSLKVNKNRDYYDGWRGKKEFAGGGVLMCQALHDLDRIIYCFGEPKVISSTIETKRDYIDIEDFAEVELLFPKGIKCSIKANTLSTESWEGKTTVTGEHGKIVLNSEYTEQWDALTIPQPEANDENYDPNVKPRYYGPCHGIIIKDFIDAIHKNTTPLVSGKDSLITLKTLFDIYQK